MMDWFVRAFFKASLTWLGLGVTLGLAMAAMPGWIIYRPAHLHLNLLGFVAMMIFGVAYHVVPRFTGHPLFSTRLAGMHWWVSNGGLLLLATGFAVTPHAHSQGAWILAIGGLFSAVGAYAFILNIWRTIDGPGVPAARAVAARPSLPMAEAREMSVAPRALGQRIAVLTLLGVATVGAQQQPQAPTAAATMVHASPVNRALPVETLTVAYAPNVPPPITRKTNARLIVRLETRELRKRLADGVEYTFWTFGGSVPGPMIRIREGDEVEFHLDNHPSSQMPHNIDLHAVTGPGGGAASSFTAPGHTSQFSFTALNAGLYVYHCATAPVGMHIANGMYGLVLVEPKDGLTPVDHEYYVLQSEFYTAGGHGDAGLQPFSMLKALDEKPDYVVFNGSVGALVGDNALHAKVGETMRLFVGNGGPNLVSSFHVIGEIFDRIFTEGGTIANQNNGQTTLIPAGGSAIVELKFEVPGTYVLVDHSIFRAFNKGALGMIKVTGPENLAVYSGKQGDFVYLPEGSTILDVPAPVNAAVPSETTPATRTPGRGTKRDDVRVVATAATSATREPSRTELMARGRIVFTNNCVACHQAAGQGVPGAFPPLARSDFLLANADRAIGTVMHGLSGPITVNGKTYNNVMPAMRVTDTDIAAVLTYVRNSFGNATADFVKVADVKRVRASGKFRPQAQGEGH